MSRLLTNPPPGGVKIDTTVTDLIHSLVDTDHGLVPDKPLPKETPGKVQKALGKSRTDKQYAETTARKAAARAEKRRQSGAGKKTENGGSSSKQRQQNGGSGRRKRN